MRVIFTGPRDLHVPLETIRYAIRQSGFEVDEVIVGDATGIDACVRAWAIGELYVEEDTLFTFKAQWGIYGRSAGPKRNAAMARFAVQDGADAGCIAIVDERNTRGTGNMMGQTRHPDFPNLRLHRHQCEHVFVALDGTRFGCEGHYVESETGLVEYP